MPTIDPSTTWHIPYPRNPFFTGREDVLIQLHNALQVDATVALSHPQGMSGLGGIGKTQAALEYAYRYKTNYQAILWVRADSTASLTSSFVELARVLKLPECDEQDQNLAVQAVLRWLRDNPGWLLIYDNIDDFTAAEPFLPKAGPGHLLFTTRSRAFGELAQRLDIQKMEPETGALLLLRRAGIIAIEDLLNAATPNDQSIARTISQELDGLPLALDQAGAYIKEAPCPLADYLTRFQARRRDILQVRGHFDQDYSASVATTWSLSFARVEQQSPMAAELLRCCAFLRPEAIPEELFIIGAAHLGKKLRQVESNPLAFDNAVRVLLSYSLIRRDPSAATLSIHRLVQAVLVDTLLSKTERQWHARVMQALNAAFPERVVDELARSERLVPHALNCVPWIKVKAYPSKAALRLLNQAGNYLRVRAQYEQAEPLFKLLVAISEEWLPPIHPARAVGLTNLGLLYQDMGRYEEAEPLLKRGATLVEPHLISMNEKRNGVPFFSVVDGESIIKRLSTSSWRKILSVLVLFRTWLFASFLATPSMRRNTAASLNNLGLFYKEQGRYKEAEPLFRHALDILESVGATHSETVPCLNNLALTYRELGRHEEIEPLLKRALAICEQELEANHPYRAQTLNNLGLFYNDHERYEEAEPLYMLALSLREEHFGETHPDTAISLNNLGNLYRERGKYAEAEPLLMRALVINEEQLGATHPDTATSLNNLALLYKEQGKYAEAEPLYLRALAIREQLLGATHPDTMNSLDTLAALYDDQKRYEKAEPLYRRVLAIKEERLGADHLDTVSTIIDLAFLYQMQESYEKAEPLYRRALKIREECLGAIHLDTAKSLTSLAYLCRKMKKYEEAELLYRRALAIQEELLGVSHPDMTFTLTMLASLYQTQARYEEAEPLYRRALAIHEEMLGVTHFDTAQSLAYLADLYLELGKYEEAKPLWMRALEIRGESLRARYSDIVFSTFDLTLQTLAIRYQTQGKYEEAELLFKRILEIHEQQLGIAHPDTVESLNNLARLYERQGRHVEAELLYKRTQAFNERQLEPKHSKRDKDRFDKFTEKALNVLGFAQEEARGFQHNYIGTEHLLLGLVRESEGNAAKILCNLGVELNMVRSAIESSIGSGDRIVLDEIGLTPRAKKAIELAVEEALHLNHQHIGTEHFLSGLVREGEGIAAGVLESFGVNLEKVRAQTIQIPIQSE